MFPRSFTSARASRTSHAARPRKPPSQAIGSAASLTPRAAEVADVERNSGAEEPPPGSTASRRKTCTVSRWSLSVPRPMLLFVPHGVEEGSVPRRSVALVRANERSASALRGKRGNKPHATLRCCDSVDGVHGF